MICRLRKYIPFVLLIVLLSSCSNDETSYQTEFCVIEERGDHSLYLHSDNGYDLSPSSSLDASIYEAGQRFRVTYIEMGSMKLLSDGKLIDVVDMLPVKIFTSLESETKSEDPVWFVADPWISGGFLNFEFSFGYQNSDKKHGIYLVRDSIVQGSEGGKVYLSFRHDANKDGTSVMATAFASSSLSLITESMDIDSLIFSVQEGRQKERYSLAIKKE